MAGPKFLREANLIGEAWCHQRLDGLWPAAGQRLSSCLRSGGPQNNTKDSPIQDIHFLEFIQCGTI